MKHTKQGASPCDLACPHLSDHPTRQAKQQNNSDHGRTVVCSDHHTGTPFLTSTGANSPSAELLAVSLQLSAFALHSPRRYFAVSLRRCSAVRPSFQKHTEHTENTRQTHPKHTQKHSRNTRIPSENTQKHTKHAPFFAGGPPSVDSLSEVAQASASPARTLPVQRLAAFPLLGAESVRSFDTRQTLDFPTQNAFLKLNLAAIFSLQPSPLSLSPHSRSACSAYPFEKIRNPIQPLAVSFQTSLRAETNAEILLRFAETSQQTLRHFSLLPTTYNNFADKNAETLKLLRLLRLDPNVNSRSCLISSPGGEDQDEGVLRPFCTLHSKICISADEGVRSFDPRQTLDFPTQNAFLKLNLAAIFSLQPLALSLSPRSACSAYPFETIVDFVLPRFPSTLNHPQSTPLLVAHHSIRRFLCLLIFFLFQVLASAAPWFDRSLVGMEVGPTGAQYGYSDPSDTRFCANFNGRDIVRAARAAGSEYLVLWSRDGDYAYYNSKILPKAPGLKDRDPLREAIDEAAASNYPLIAYDVIQGEGHFLHEHQELAMRDMDGKPLTNKFCLNSDYIDWMKRILDEQLAYGVAGFHIDMIDQGFDRPYGCWCDRCEKKFQERYHHPMPRKLTWDQEWSDVLEFRYATSEAFEKELYRHIKSRNPNATVDFNYHGNPPYSFEVGQRPVQHAATGDFVTGETGAWGFSAMTVSLNAEFYRAATPGRPYQVAIQRGVRVYHDQTTRPVNDIRWELYSILAHGGFATMIDKTGLSGALDPVAYERIGDAFHDVLKCRKHFGQPPWQEVGIYFSSRARDFFGREKPFDYFHPFLGAQKALWYEHISWGIVLDENLSLDGLKQFKTLILPGTTIITDREFKIFREYLEQGGNLVITGLSGLRDDFGEKLEHSRLENLIGARFVKELDSSDNWVSFTAAPQKKSDQSQSELGMPVRPDWPFLVKGAAVIYEPTDAKPYGKLHKPQRTTRQKDGLEPIEWPSTMSPDEAVGPALLTNEIGKGKVITFACSPDYAVGSEWHLVEDRRMLARAIRLLNPTPRIEIKAPAYVETIVTDDPKVRELRVHFVCWNPGPQTMAARNRPHLLPGLIEELPMYRAQIEPAFKIKSARAINSTTKLSREKNAVNAVIEDVHEVLLLKY
jgi:hypothetical protein